MGVPFDVSWEAPRKSNGPSGSGSGIFVLYDRDVFIGFVPQHLTVASPSSLVRVDGIAV